MSSNLLAEVEKQRHNVIVDSYTATWNELLEQFKRKDIAIGPAYQRAFRWTLEQQTQYIESLLLSIPTPPIFLAELDDGTFEVIDGLQRFSTVVKFFYSDIEEDEVKVNPRKHRESHWNDLTVPTVLTEAPILKGLLGLSLESMPETLVRTLRYSRVPVILIERKSSELAKYHVFMRLNRAGTSLSDQEIRNCSARLFNSDFADSLMEISGDPSVQGALKLSDADRRSMGAQENILRLIAFSYFRPETQRIDEFLNRVMYLVASGEFKFTKKIKSNLLGAFEAIYMACPNGEAFRFIKDGEFKGGFSTNLFDIVACGVYKNLSSVQKGGPEKLRRKIEEMHSVDEALSLTGAGSNTKAKMLGRVEFGVEWFK